MVENLGKLFCVAQADAMSMIIAAEDKFFLEDQRGYMGSVDRTFARTKDREVKRLKNEEYLRSKEEHRKRENIVIQAGDELASEEEITSMRAEHESNLEPLSLTKEKGCQSWGS